MVRAESSAPRATGRGTRGRTRRRASSESVVWALSRDHALRGRQHALASVTTARGTCLVLRATGRGIRAPMRKRQRRGGERGSVLTATGTTRSCTAMILGRPTTPLGHAAAGAAAVGGTREKPQEGHQASGIRHQSQIRCPKPEALPSRQPHRLRHREPSDVLPRRLQGDGGHAPEVRRGRESHPQPGVLRHPCSAVGGQAREVERHGRHRCGIAIDVLAPQVGAPPRARAAPRSGCPARRYERGRPLQHRTRPGVGKTLDAHLQGSSTQTNSLVKL